VAPKAKAPAKKPVAVPQLPMGETAAPPVAPEMTPAQERELLAARQAKEAEEAAAKRKPVPASGDPRAEGLISQWATDGSFRRMLGDLTGKYKDDDIDGVAGLAAAEAARKFDGGGLDDATFAEELRKYVTGAVQNAVKKSFRKSAKKGGKAKVASGDQSVGEGAGTLLDRTADARAVDPAEAGTGSTLADLMTMAKLSPADQELVEVVAKSKGDSRDNIDWKKVFREFGVTDPAGQRRLQARYAAAYAAMDAVRKVNNSFEPVIARLPGWEDDDA